MRRAFPGNVFSIVTGLPALTADADRDVYFGEAHVPTSWSLDALAAGRARAVPGSFRFYSSQKAVFDKTWVLPDIEEVQ